MESCNAGNARVVQATVVQPTVAQGIRANQFGPQVQAVQVGQPVHGTVIGQPVYVQRQDSFHVRHSDSFQVHHVPMAWSPEQSADMQSASTAWMLYGVGCFLCFCFGPIGPIFWFVVACMHFCKPKEVRQQHPQEQQVAMLSLATGVLSTALTIACILILTSLAAVVPEVGEAKVVCAVPCRTYDWGMSGMEADVCISTRGVCSEVSVYGCNRHLDHCRQQKYGTSLTPGDTGDSGDAGKIWTCKFACSASSDEEAIKKGQKVCFDSVTRLCSKPSNSTEGAFSKNKGCLEKETKCTPRV